MKNKCYTALKIILYCFLAVSIIICVRALIVSGVAASAENDATPALTVIVVFCMLLLYAPLPVAFADMLYCVRYFESGKKTPVKTVANCFFVLLSLGMIVNTVLMMLGTTKTNAPMTIFIYLAMRLLYMVICRIKAQ